MTIENPFEMNDTTIARLRALFPNAPGFIRWLFEIANEESERGEKARQLLQWATERSLTWAGRGGLTAAGFFAGKVVGGPILGSAILVLQTLYWIGTEVEKRKQHEQQYQG